MPSVCEQTKEHLYGGRCTLTAQMYETTSQELRETMEEWGLNKAQRDTIEKIWKTEEEKVNSEVHCLETHSRAPVLIGIWKKKPCWRSGTR